MKTGNVKEQQQKLVYLLTLNGFQEQQPPHSYWRSLREQGRMKERLHLANSMSQDLVEEWVYDLIKVEGASGEAGMCSLNWQDQNLSLASAEQENTEYWELAR